MVGQPLLDQRTMTLPFTQGGFEEPGQTLSFNCVPARRMQGVQQIPLAPQPAQAAIDIDLGLTQMLPFGLDLQGRFRCSWLEHQTHRSSF